MRPGPIQSALIRVGRGALSLTAIVALIAAVAYHAARLHDVRQLARAGEIHAATLDTPTALLVFQPWDCVESYAFLHHWERESARRGLRLVGAPLVEANAVETAMAAVRRAGLELPLDVSMARTAERIGLLGGYRNTPFVLVFDNGRLREVHGPDR